MAKIPATAKKVFEGVIFDVYQWEQELFDGSTATFEMVKRPYTTEVIPVMPDGSIAVAFEQQPHMHEPVYGLFSGRMEEGEVPLEAIQRELAEETGMSSDSWGLWQEYAYPGKVDWTVYTFIAKQCKKTSGIHLEPGEKIEVKFLDPEKFVKVACTDHFRSREISDYLYRLRAEGRLDEFYKLLQG